LLTNATGALMFTKQYGFLGGEKFLFFDELNLTAGLYFLKFNGEMPVKKINGEMPVKFNWN